MFCYRKQIIGACRTGDSKQLDSILKEVKKVKGFVDHILNAKFHVRSERGEEEGWGGERGRVGCGEGKEEGWGVGRGKKKGGVCGGERGRVGCGEGEGVGERKGGGGEGKGVGRVWGGERVWGRERVCVCGEGGEER